MDKNDYLEMISDQIRSGVPVSILDACAAITYQNAMREEREKNRWHRRISRRAKAAIEAWRNTP